MHDKKITEAEAASGAISWRGPRLSLWDAFSGPSKDKPVHEDTCVKILIDEGWGMQELRVKVDGQIDVKQFEHINRAQQHEQMKLYFSDTIQIIPNPKDSPKLPDVPWAGAARGAIVWFAALGLSALLAPVIFFAITAKLYWVLLAVLGLGMGGVLAFNFITLLMHRFRTDRIWPGLMEERLHDAIERKFAQADLEIRCVIDRYSDVFLDSNWMLVRLKRFFQALSIICFYLACAPLFYFLAIGNLLAAAISGGGALVVALIVFQLFNFANKYVYLDKYSQSLRVSAQHVTNLILERTTSINVLFQHTINHITQLLPLGETPRRDPSKIEDVDLKDDYDTFFAMQTLIWLAKRLEYIELHLHNTLHTLLTVEAIFSIAGYVMFLSLLIIGVVPSACLLIHAAFVAQTAFAHGDYNTLYAAGGEAAAAIGIIALTCWVSFISYYNERWNPLKTMSSDASILNEHFESKLLGQTYVKQELDIKLAARAQRAMFAIHNYFDRLGFSGGRSQQPNP